MEHTHIYMYIYNCNDIEIREHPIKDKCVRNLIINLKVFIMPRNLTYMTLQLIHCYYQDFILLSRLHMRYKYIPLHLNTRIRF